MRQKRSFDILYEDKDIIVVNKPSGLLMIATEKDDRPEFCSCCATIEYHRVLKY